MRNINRLLWHVSSRTTSNGNEIQIFINFKTVVQNKKRNSVVTSYRFIYEKSIGGNVFVKILRKLIDIKHSKQLRTQMKTIESYHSYDIGEQTKWLVLLEQFKISFGISSPRNRRGKEESLFTTPEGTTFTSGTPVDGIRVWNQGTEWPTH